MGFWKHLPAVMFVIINLTIGAFAAAVYSNAGAKGLYEKHLKDKLEAAEFFFTWVGIFYFVMPMLSYTVVDDWSKTFFDCFTPLTLWLDAIYSCVVITQLTVFIGDIQNSSGRIMLEFGGLSILLSCLYGYVMLKSSNDPSFDHASGQKQNVWALLFLAVFGFVAILQTKFYYQIPAGEYSGIAWWLAALGVTAQLVQPISSMFLRALSEDENSFNDDDPSSARIKITAAVLRVITLTYDVWWCISKDYFGSPDKIHYARLVVLSLVINWIQATIRYIGPRKIKDKFDAYWEREEEEIRQRATSTDIGDRHKTISARTLRGPMTH